MMVRAIRNGDLASLQSLYDTGSLQLTAEHWITAVECGDLHILQWLKEKEGRWPNYLCAHAAREGHMETLKWLRKKGCPWDAFACAYAAEGGHLHILQWLREMGCPWNESTCLWAAADGHTNIFAWALEHGCPCNRTIIYSLRHYVSITRLIASLDKYKYLTITYNVEEWVIEVDHICALLEDMGILIPDIINIIKSCI